MLSLALIGYPDFPDYLKDMWRKTEEELESEEDEDEDSEGDEEGEDSEEAGQEAGDEEGGGDIHSPDTQSLGTGASTSGDKGPLHMDTISLGEDPTLAADSPLTRGRSSKRRKKKKKRKKKLSCSVMWSVVTPIQSRAL